MEAQIKDIVGEEEEEQDIKHQFVVEEEEEAYDEDGAEPLEDSDQVANDQSIVEGQQDLDDIIIAEAVQVWIHLKLFEDKLLKQVIWSIGDSIQL